jgi:hypothetical protein
MDLIKRNGMKLVHKATGETARIGEMVELRDGKARLTGGEPPHKEGSTGRVWVRQGALDRTFFPSVCNLEWVSDAQA